MNFETARAAIHTLFEAAWDDPLDPGTPRTPWYTANRPGKSGAPEYVTVIVEELTSRQHTNGNKIMERPAVLIVEMNLELGKGTSRADQLTNAIKEAFESRRLSTDLIFRALTPKHYGAVNGFYRVVLSVPFVYYEPR